MLAIKQLYSNSVGLGIKNALKLQMLEHVDAQILKFKLDDIKKVSIKCQCHKNC